MKPKKRNLNIAIIEAKKYKDRYEMFRLCPALYKWFRVNGHMDVLFDIHPPKFVKGTWSDETVQTLIEEAASLMMSRADFKKAFPGAYGWMQERGLLHMLHERIGSLKGEPWTEGRVLECFEKVSSWTEFRKKFPNARQWLQKEKKARVFRKILEGMNG